jgi:hypothetical protein
MNARAIWLLFERKVVPKVSVEQLLAAIQEAQRSP